MNAPLISTIIPTYKRPERLKKALQSVLNQTYPHFQVYVYDNASNDSTAEVVAHFAKQDSRIQYFCHSENIGAVANFQFGLDKVSTPFFSILSDDDFLLPEFYEITLKGFERYSSAAFSSAAVIDQEENGQIIDVALHRWPNQEYYEPPNGLFEMIGKYSNWIGSLFRKEVLEKVGPLNASLKAIDVDFLFRAAAQLPFVISKKKGAVFIHHSQSYSGRVGLRLVWPGWLNMIETLKTAPLMSVQAQVKMEKLLLANLGDLLFSLSLKEIKKKNFLEALEIAQVFDRYSSANRRKWLLVKLIRWSQASLAIHTLFQLAVWGRSAWKTRMVKLSTKKIIEKLTRVASHSSSL